MQSIKLNSSEMDFEQNLERYREQIESAIDTLLPSADTRPARLHAAMRYSLQAGGKRLRPILLLASHQLFPSKCNPFPAAVAMECLHTYSLIHDDLPCMDNSDLRRGTPTCHVAFDQATALLAGDALLTFAFQLLADHYGEHPTLATALIRDLGTAAGSERLIGGQMEDLLGEQNEPTAEQLEYIHRNKTAALITTSLTMGIRMADVPTETITKMAEVGHHLGLAFQIIDDILDSTADAETLGKPSGADVQNGKMTYPALLGLEVSKSRARQHTEQAVSLCQSIGGDNTFLLDLIATMLERNQ